MSAGFSSRCDGWPIGRHRADDPGFGELGWNIVNFRSGLIRALNDRGYRIVVAAPDDDYRSKLADLGVTFVPVPINSPGVSVAEDLRLLARYFQICRQFRPFAFLGFTP